MLEFRLFHPDSAQDAATLFGLMDQAREYFLLVEGKLPTIEDAAKDLFALPPGKQLQDKCYAGYWKDGALVGCMEIVRGYPEPDIAYLGLLLFGEAHQGQGYGVVAMTHIRELAHSWGCTRLRLAVIDKNVRGLRFWQRQGFVELYRKPRPEFTGDAIVMQRAL
jgi:GNAT superfamily N-acetyltransferase